MKGRETLRNILDRKDKRLFVVVGPCSIHDPVAGLDYARRLKALQAEVADTMVLVMRVYFEKPRTTTGWKGYINDPFMDDSFRVDVGMERARQFLLDVCELGLPTATEALDPISPQYLGDLIAWTAIGARTTESQTHREMSSGLSTPVGFKNGTDGDVEHRDQRRAVLVQSRTPSWASTARARSRSCAPRQRLRPRGAARRRRTSELRFGVGRDRRAGAEEGRLPANLVVDCSHANSYKKPELQPLVMSDVIQQIRHGNGSLVGVMIESNIVSGNQPIPAT
jgi:3-deoxy-7-phosphoheptulonate synthase